MDLKDKYTVEELAQMRSASAYMEYFQRKSYRKSISQLSGKLNKTIIVQETLSRGTLLLDVESGGWTARTDTVQAADTTHKQNGANSISVTTQNSTTNGKIWKQVNLGVIDGGNQNIGIWFYVDDITKLAVQTVRVLLGTTNGFTRRMGRYLSYDNGWNFAVIKPSEWTSSGGGVWSDSFDYIQFETQDVTAGTHGSVSFDSVYIGTIVQDAPQILITFDDWLKTIYTYGYGYMKARGVRGTFYIVSDTVSGGGPTVVTPSQLLEMQSEGWIIGNHTKDHTDLTTLTDAQVQTEVTTCKTYLQGIGITGNGPLHVSYVGGTYNSVTLGAIKTAGMLSGRGAIGTQPDNSPLSVYTLDNEQSFSAAYSLASGKAWIDAIVSRNGRGIALFHDFAESSPTGNQWLVSDFNAWIDYALSKNVVFLTIDDLYKLQTNNIQID
jgi:peptidoglycan/xylan/chitin deacetylase (PgdA/CDA1 family)